MSEFEIEFNPNDDDIKQMIKLDTESYKGSEDCGVFEKCMQWKQICPDIYTAIKLDGKIVGYINFVAITEECYIKIKSGQLKDYELSLDDILPFNHGINYCLFMSVVIEKKFRDTEVVIRLSNAFFEKVSIMKQKNVMLENVLCDCVSEDGENYVKKVFNAKHICNSKNGTKIYEFKL